MKNYKKTTNKFKILLLYTAVLISLTMLELALPVLTAMIPRSAISQSVKESAVYLMENSVFYRIEKNNPASEIDHYADSILLNIIYNYEDEHPLSSVLSSSYYHSDTKNENENLFTAVSDDVQPTYEYSRYWHGSSVFIRPLLLIFNIRQIYILSAFVLLVLIAAVLTALHKYHKPEAIAAVIISLVSVSFWYVPMSLEYLWCFLITFAAAYCVIILYRRKGTVSPLLFFIVGNLTAYFDFLTTETMTLLFPLSLLLIFMYDDKKITGFKTGFFLILRNCISWGIGYVFSWLAKWTIASVVLHKNIFTQALSAAETRAYGDSYGMNTISLSLSAVARNISCLFPFNYIQKNGYIWAVLCFLILMVVFYLFRKIKNRNAMPVIFFIIFSVPYIRYITLANHAFLHYFFTYRAQFASVFSLCMFFYYGIDVKLLSKYLPFISGFRNPSR